MVKVLIPALFLLLACPLWGGGGESHECPPRPAETTGTSLDAEWELLLEKAVVHTAAARALVQSAADREEDDPARELARVLLDEWDADTADQRLGRPRLILTPRPSVEEMRALLPGTITAQVVLMSGRVTTEGSITEPIFLVESDYPRLNQQALESFCSARYRPARDQSGYVEQRIELKFHVGVD